MENDNITTINFNDIQGEEHLRQLFPKDRERKAYQLALEYANSEKLYSQVETQLSKLNYRFTQFKGNGKITLLLKDSKDGNHFKFIG